LREVGVLLLAGGAEDLTYDEQGKLVKGVGFVGEGVERGGEREHLQESKRRRASALKQAERVDAVKPRAGWPVGVRACAQT
jgi:hypothetical protein